AEQLAAFKKKEAARRRNAIIGRVLAGAGILAGIAVVITGIVINSQPQPIVQGLETWDDLEAPQVDSSLNYEKKPPAGGPHNREWFNCGVYDEVQIEEHAVHSLEHGAVWITYDPGTTSDSEIEALRDITPDSYAILSPYPGIGEAF